MVDSKTFGIPEAKGLRVSKYFTLLVYDIHYSKKLKEHDQHHLWYVDTLRSSC